MKISRRIALAAILPLFSCSPPSPPVQSTSQSAPHYVDARLCAGCHAAHSETFHQTGMGRAFYRATPASMADHFRDGASFYHKPSDRYYQMIHRGDAFLIRRFQKGAGNTEINVVESRIDYVMGSGNHARSYLHRTEQNRLLQLPITWYPDEKDPRKPGLFAMSPGYDRPDHLDFRRKIGYDCFFCHDAYPELPAGRDAAGADPVYPAELPEGIDCQRCHGPGSAHIEAVREKRPAAEVRRAIVNPARLPNDRQLEICMQCHLETTSFVLPASIQRYERGTFSFRPGEPLEAYMLHFDHAKGTGHDDKFEIVSAAYRLRQSTCFTASGGALVCTTCHNPHRPDTQYAQACTKCHQPKLQNLIASGRHTADTNCLPCHMAKRRTEDVIHAVMTDHRILRRQPARDLLAPLAERHDSEGSYHGEVVLYYPPHLDNPADRDLYGAVAQVGQKSNIQAGIPRLEAALRTYRPRRPEFYVALAQAYLGEGHLDQAIAAYKRAREADPKFLPAMRGLGAAYAKNNLPLGALGELERARAMQSDDAATLHELGLVYRDLGRNADALAAIQQAVRQDPDLPEIRNSLGNLLFETGDRDRAEEAFREAVRAQPDLAAAHVGLGNALAARGDTAGAEGEYRLAVQFDPSNSAAQYGFGAALASRGRFDEAQKHIEEAVRLAPDMPEAQTILGDLLSRRNQWRLAIPHYNAALERQPTSGRAHLGLGTALGATGDSRGARYHLEIAAADPDPDIRQEAQELLQRISK